MVVSTARRNTPSRPLIISGLWLGATWVVESATRLARRLGVSDLVIGLTVVAIGTSAPELATSLVAMKRGQHGMSAGNLLGSDLFNLLGSDLFNLLGVLGLAAVLQPLSVDVAARGSITMLAGMMILVVFMMRTGWRVSRMEGGVLMLLTLVRWVLDFSRG